MLTQESPRQSRVLRFAEFAFVWPAVFLMAPALGAQGSEATRQAGTTLRGTVHDSAGRAVADAHVVLRGDRPLLSREETTDVLGHFVFKDVATGTYSLTANQGSLRGQTVAVTVSTSGEQPLVDMVLSGPQSQTPTARDVSQGMQFADNPDFAISALTDWTAAGGHGSDASLRTSEALTQQAVTLKSSSTKPTAAGLPSGTPNHEESESILRAAVAKDPRGLVANYSLGRFYIEAGRYEDAIQPLKVAYEADPSNFDNEYDLAEALKMTGHAAEARDHVRGLLARRETADLRRMKGELDEKLGDPMSAVHEFQQAASMNPSEDNYFAWGSELLIHRAVWQAKEVFDEGTRLFPQSTRMLTARGAALFAGALYDEAALDLCKASDLNPEIAEPYLFMGKIEIVAPNPLPCVVEKLARFEKLQPNNALASYYYAMALWKQQGQVDDSQVMGRVEGLLTRAVIIDPKCAQAYLELGNLSAGRKQWEQAIGRYLSAIQADPKLNEAHYRLGVAYQRSGDQAKAKEQFQLHDTIAREEAAEVQRQRKEVKQFTVVNPDQVGKQRAQ